MSDTTAEILPEANAMAMLRDELTERRSRIASLLCESRITHERTRGLVHLDCALDLAVRSLSQALVSAEVWAESEAAKHALNGPYSLRVAESS